MKTHIIFALTIAVAVNAFAQQTPADWQTVLQRQTPHRTGTVRYPSGEPAAGVHIMFYPYWHYSDGDYNYHEAITDKSGHYEILPPNKVSGLVSGPVILTNCIMARDLEKNFAAVEAFPVAVTNVDLTLEPGIMLSGSVKNIQNEPVSNGDVMLSFRSGNAAIELRWEQVKTDKTGSFSISALPQGHEYWIKAKADSYGTGDGDVEAKDTQTNSYRFPTIALKHADHKVAGRVLDSDGKPVAGAEVELGGLGQQLSVTKTASDGKFHFDAVCEGDARIHAVLWGSPPVNNGSSGTIVQAGDINVVIQLAAPNR